MQMLTKPAECLLPPTKLRDIPLALDGLVVEWLEGQPGFTLTSYNLPKPTEIHPMQADEVAIYGGSWRGEGSITMVVLGSRELWREWLGFVDKHRGTNLLDK